MKKILIVSVVIIIAAVAICHAATLQWSYVLTDKPCCDEYPQIAADGKGGCAIMYYNHNANDGPKLVMIWLDKNGKVKTVQEHVDAVWYGSEIILCTPKYVVYGFTGSGESFVTISIDNKLNIDVIGGTDKHEAATTWGENDVRSKCPQADKKGFFVQENLPPDGSTTNIIRVSRYTCK